jgi:hypothetical protein
MEKPVDKIRQVKFVRLYDIAKKCLILIDHVYEKINKTTELLENSNGSMTDEYQTCELYLDIFSFIDFSHRFLQIIDSMPLLSKKRKEVRKLNSTTSSIKDCRNYLQHLRGELNNEEIIEYPILGSISWIRNKRNYILLPTQATEKHSSAGITYDTHNHIYVCNYQFTVGNHELKIDKIYEELKEFWNWFETVTHIEPKGIKVYRWGKPNIIITYFDKSSTNV